MKLHNLDIRNIVSMENRIRYTRFDLFCCKDLEINIPYPNDDMKIILITIIM